MSGTSTRFGVARKGVGRVLATTRRSSEGLMDFRVSRQVKLAQKRGPDPSLLMPISQPCTESQLREPTFERWRARLKESAKFNRKVWEWAWICQHLEMEQARRSNSEMKLVGFGVGSEPIVGWLAGQGHRVLATDLPSDAAEVEAWSPTGQHASDFSGLDSRRIVPPEVLADRVDFRPVDMRRLPADLGVFDAMWSSCAIEHLGSLQAGLDFVRSALGHCEPGGLALHTTELNVSHDRRTVERGPVVAYRRSDLEEFFQDLRVDGHQVEATFNLGDLPGDSKVDRVPFSGHHLKIPLEDVVITSFGIAIRVGQPG